LGLAVLILPGLAFAQAYKYSPIETWGWKAELPEGWKQIEAKKEDPSKPYDGLWRYQSANTSWRLRVGIHVIKKAESDFKVRTKNTFDRLMKRVPELQILRANTVKVGGVGGREMFYLLGRAERERKGQKIDFMVFKMFSVFKKENLWLAATLTVANDKLENFLEVVDKFMESFELVEPKSADEALKKHGPAGDLR
jgi:hypothetical protein